MHLQVLKTNNIFKGDQNPQESTCHERSCSNQMCFVLTVWCDFVITINWLKFLSRSTSQLGKVHLAWGDFPPPQSALLFAVLHRSVSQNIKLWIFFDFHHFCLHSVAQSAILAPPLSSTPLNGSRCTFCLSVCFLLSLILWEDDRGKIRNIWKWGISGVQWASFRLRIQRLC